MESNEAIIFWKLEDETHQKKVILRHNRLLLSRYFLQCLLPPSRRLLSLKSVIQVGQETMEITTPSEWDVENNELFVLDSSLTRVYKIEHIGEMMCISDSESKESCEILGHFTNATTTEAQNVEETNYNDINSGSAETGWESDSTVHWIRESQQKSRLYSLIQQVKDVTRVKELPQHYNGDIIFELPPSQDSSSRMQGLEQRFDGHPWTRPQKTNMVIQCTVRLSYCLGSLVCHRTTCPYYATNHRFNALYFHGYMDRQIGKGLLCEDEKSGIKCHYCKRHVFCEETCCCKAYYVLPLDSSKTRLMIHLGSHQHDVQSGTSRAAIARIKKMVATILQVDRHNGPRRVQMIIARQILTDAIVGSQESTFEEIELSNILEEMIPLVQNQRFNSIVAVERKRQQAIVIGDGYDQILQLKKKCLFPFFHGSRFPGQGGPNDKCFIFKMSTKSPGSGVDLVNRMRRTSKGDLKDAWVHFDYTHRIANWATMSCSVYDPSLKGLMVIAICDTKEEDTQTQILFWTCLNDVMIQQGYPPADFAGFMSDEAGANWAAIRTVYNSGPDNVMEGRERSCLFHWEQSLHRHSKKYIPREKQLLHINMCEEWRKSLTATEASEAANNIEKWWHKNLLQDHIAPLRRWFNWWETRILHWGNLHSQTSLSPWEQAQIPNTNLSESIHGSWLAGEGGNKKISLYDACVTDVVNAYLQCTKQHGHITGRFLGTGPDMQCLLERVASQKTPSPSVVARAVESGVAGTPMYDQPTFNGDKETVQRKKLKSTEFNSAHKPGFVMESRQRKQKGRPRKINFEQDPEGQQIFDVNADSTDEDTINITNFTSTPNIMQTMLQKEIKVQKSCWAIRRMPSNCLRKCFGVVKGKKCSNVMQSRTPGLVAPCFWGVRSFKGQSQEQWIWFCNHDVQHTAMVSKQVMSPPMAPITWVIEKGTNLTSSEIAGLEGAGFALCDYARQPDSIPGVGSSKTRAKKWRSGISQEASKRLEAAERMHAIFIQESTVVPNHHVIFQIQAGNIYEVHVKEEPWCTCLDFQQRETRKKSYLACKHLYFVFSQVLGLDPLQHKIIHQPVLKDRDLVFILSQKRRIAPSSTL